MVAPSAEQHAVVAEETGLTHFLGFGPPGRAISGGALCLPGSPYRHGDRHGDGRDPSGGGDVRALDEDVSRIRVVGEPPPEEGRRMIDGPTEEFEPWKAELGLEGQTPSDPFRCPPDEGEHDGADQEYLAPEDLGRVHGDLRSGSLPMPTAIAEKSRLASGMLRRAERTHSLSCSRRFAVIQGSDGDGRLALECGRKRCGGSAPGAVVRLPPHFRGA